MDCSITEINFLGVTVTKFGNKLEADLYCIRNDTQQYVHAKSCHSNLYRRSIAYGQAVRFKRICSIEQKLNTRLEQLKKWLVKRRYKEGHVDSEIESVKLVKRTVFFQKQDKKVDDSVKLVLSYHPALNQLYEILRRTYKQFLKSPRLHSALRSPPRVAFRNPKIIRDKLIVRSKNLFIKMLAPIFVVFVVILTMI